MNDEADLKKKSTHTIISLKNNHWIMSWAKQNIFSIYFEISKGED
jgi:hypothetical protein